MSVLVQMCVLDLTHTILHHFEVDSDICDIPAYYDVDIDYNALSTSTRSTARPGRYLNMKPITTTDRQKKDPAAWLRFSLAADLYIQISYSFSQTALQRFRLNAMP